MINKDFKEFIELLNSNNVKEPLINSVRPEPVEG